jgi:PPOX class probable F420-dependent enzyme
MSRATAILGPDVREFLAGGLRFGVVATINPDGSPHQVPVWYAVTQDGVLLNSRVGRRWPTNLLRDPRASFTVVDGYRYVLLRGEVEVIDDPTRALGDIEMLARRYHADDSATAERKIAVFRTQQRIGFLLRPDTIVSELEA